MPRRAFRGPRLDRRAACRPRRLREPLAAAPAPAAAAGGGLDDRGRPRGRDDDRRGSGSLHAGGQRRGRGARHAGGRAGRRRLRAAAGTHLQAAPLRRHSRGGHRRRPVRLLERQRPGGDERHDREAVDEAGHEAAHRAGSGSRTATSSRTSGHRPTSSKGSPTCGASESARAASFTSAARSTRRGSLPTCRPRSARASSAPSRRDYARSPFPADFWIDPKGRVRRVHVSYRTGSSGRIVVDCDLLGLRRPCHARTAAARRTRRTSRRRSSVRALGPLPREPRREHALVGRRGELEVADRERRPAEHVERAQERRQLEAHRRARRSPPAAAAPPRPARRRGRPRAGSRATGATASRARAASSGVTDWAASSFARTFAPYSRARAGNVARCDSAASQLKSGQVSSGGSGISASTTRAPSASSCSTYCSAARFPGSGGPPTDGGRVSSPTVSPASSGSGTGASASTDHISATSATVRAIGPTVSKVGHEREHAVERDAAPARLEPDDAAAGRRQPNRAARVGAEPDVAEPRGDGSGVAARGAAGRAAGLRRVVDGAVPGVLARHAPGELVQVRLADEHRPRRQQPLERRWPSGPGRGRRRSTSRTSSGSRRCRSGP